jgi:phage replication-related protein YjqB (UPF0714/DUF867 family)
MSDEYGCFQELAAAHRQGVDYAVRLRELPGALLVLAPHGGGIEPGTSEIADAVAGEQFSFYAFEGLLPKGNGRLHITSHRFDEPQCLALLQHAKGVVAIHGEDSATPAIFVGGRHCAMRERVSVALVAAGFPAKAQPEPGLQGIDPSNICNRAGDSGGVQLELSVGFRSLLFDSLSASGRKRPTLQFQAFANALRNALARESASALTRS